MATNPNSILARGTVTEDDWYTEINNALDGYNHALTGLADPEATELQIVMRMSVANTYRKILSEHGVTVCGRVGHA